MEEHTVTIFFNSGGKLSLCGEDFVKDDRLIVITKNAGVYKIPLASINYYIVRQK